jgi:putative inorganic carbon (hco3(-)) transporter
VNKISKQEKKKLIWFYAIVLFFVGINLFLATKDVLWFNVLPIVAVILFLYFFSMDKILLFIAFTVPLSIILSEKDFGVSIYLPSEALLIGVLILSFFKFILNPNIDKRLIKHPISIIILIQLFWILFTSFTSEMPIVSFKFLFSRLWFIVPFYFLAIQLFRKKENVKVFIYLYAVALFIVVGYTLIHHYQWSFDGKAAHWVMKPFFNDHTSYGAILSLIIPVVIGFSFKKEMSRQQKYLSLSLGLIFLIALFFSYSRAAWLGTALSLGAFIVLSLKIKFKWLALGFLIMLGIGLSMRSHIIRKMEKNQQDSSAEFVEHVQSMSNITSDASNLERINRWQCALRMFKERPVFGWGPGTYQFVYAPFQISSEKTIISTNAGDMGNAHSEYLGPLSEQGIPGIALMLLLVIYISYLSVKLYKKETSRDNRIIILMCFLGLLSYFFHGILNNFLDTDKASALFWGYIAVIVSYDIYGFDKSKKNEEIKEIA